jgi:hypothetical protein
MKKRKKGRRFNTSAVRQSPRQRTVELEPEELAIYVRRAEKEVLPIIKEMQLGPGTAQFLLVQQTQILVTGDPRLTTESGMAIANNVLALWQEGYYTPGPAYPPLHTGRGAAGAAGKPKSKGELRAIFPAIHPYEQRRDW